MNPFIEPFFFCLLASMIWAPIIFIAAAKINQEDAPAIADKVWPLALMIAALPAMTAPFAAAFGLSLRTAAPLPPMAPIETTTDYVGPAAPITYAPIASITFSSVLEAAAILYFYGFLLFLALGLVRHIWFAYRVHYAFNLDEPALETALEDWRRQMGLKRRPRYAFSDIVSSVCVHGFFRPVILMPDNLLDRVSIKDAALMGAHEMAHIKRGDTALFAFCTGVKAVFWFNPFMQRIAARAALAAEQAADALVIASGADRRRYAECFVQGLRFAAGQKFAGRELVPSFTPFDRKSRRERLDAILSGAGAASFLNTPNKIGLGLSVIVASGLAFAQAALAVSPRPPEEALPQAPVEGDITMKFREESKLLGKERRYHEGVDIKAPRGTVVRAAGDGKVIDATKRYRGQTAWGKVVVIDHGHGLVTRYAHLDSFLVKKGDTVNAGDAIGAVGATGKATGPHLHFEVIKDGLPIDPTPVVAAVPLPAPAPVEAAAPKPKIVFSRSTAPSPEAAPEPNATPEPVEPIEPVDLEESLAGGLGEFEERMRKRFKNFKVAGEIDFDDFQIDLNDFDIEGFPHAEEFTEQLTQELNDKFADMHFSFSGMDGYDVSVFEDGKVKGFHFFSKDMSDKDREKLKREQKKAMERAHRDMERAKRDQERAKRARERTERERERAEQDHERAMELAQREIERAEDQAEKERDRAELELEHALEAAERQLERTEREWTRLIESGGQIDERTRLKMREKALREAKADLEQGLAEIERARKKLDRKERGNKDK